MPVCVGYISRNARRREYIAGECGVSLPRAQAKPMATTPPKRNEEPGATPRRGPEGSFGALPAHSRNSQFSHKTNPPTPLRGYVLGKHDTEAVVSLHTHNDGGTLLIRETNTTPDVFSQF